MKKTTITWVDPQIPMKILFHYPSALFFHLVLQFQKLNFPECFPVKMKHIASQIIMLQQRKERNTHAYGSPILNRWYCFSRKPRRKQMLIACVSRGIVHARKVMLEEELQSFAWNGEEMLWNPAYRKPIVFWMVGSAVQTEISNWLRTEVCKSNAT